MQAITDACNEERERLYKERTRQDYTLASMIVNFFGCSFNNKPIPDYEELFPQERTEDDEEAQMAFYRDQFMMMAEQHNMLRKGSQ